MRDRPRDMEILCRISGSELLESFFMVPALLPSLQWWSKLERAPFSNALIGRKKWIRRALSRALVFFFLLIPTPQLKKKSLTIILKCQFRRTLSTDASWKMKNYQVTFT
ncbi:uncharacterized protein CIMG_11118 [Coccidioides immitis RS]|uniref:Uncharacterized protein n=1 Tax=Coccidioides immitis (strain RS) TaxID=246410 RepID=A0A0D8JZ09_COCIM|nr:uncharacterized protein CIMG_11118 [Coccidioides immitis RS]KJF61498.1 hypothetical protein CIMG_11118 [Coccidioides immitis RS]